MQRSDAIEILRTKIDKLPEAGRTAIDAWLNTHGTAVNVFALVQLGDAIGTLNEWHRQHANRAKPTP